MVNYYPNVWLVILSGVILLYQKQTTMAKNYWMSENRGQNWLDVWNMKHAKELLETKTSQVLAEDGKVFGGWKDDRTGKSSDGYWTLENNKAVYTHTYYND